MKPEERLEKLVNSPSPTTSQSDVRRTHALIADELQRLGFSINWVRDPSGKTDDLLVAERPATEPLFITLVSHVDTVLSTREAGTFRAFRGVGGERRASGAGIIDNKGGLVVLLESLRLFLERGSPSVGLRVVSSPDEESGSSAWHDVFRKIGENSAAVLGFEPALDDGSIISSRRGNRWYDITVTGVEAHAGRCKGEEINAAHAATLLIHDLLKRKTQLRETFGNRPGEGISIHVGHLVGGRGPHNVVCGSVTIKLDTRFTSFAESEAIQKMMDEELARPRETNVHGSSAKIQARISDDCRPFDADATAAEVIGKLCARISKLEGRSVQAIKAGGAGDVNHMSRPGLLVLDGLGPVGGLMHTVDEFIDLDSLSTRATALADWYPELIDWLRLR